MKKIFILMFLVYFTTIFASSKNMGTNGCFFSNEGYKEEVLKKVAETLPDLRRYPSYHYPNDGHEQAFDHFPTGKVLIFGYGSLINKASARRTIKSESVEAMQTAVAFGVKRVFNYKASKATNWGTLDVQEKAMLNLVQTLNIASVANGVIIEVDQEDLSKLVLRETGYDLIPILVINEKDISSMNPDIEVKVAYTFIAMNELRNHINYTSTKYYPIRGYLHAVQEAAATYGEKFAQNWNKTTFMADGITRIDDWDEETFNGILCTFEPGGPL